MGMFGSGVDPAGPTSYLGLVTEDPIIAPSALKHGLDEPEILHAYRNPVRIWDLGDGFTMIVGPNQSAIFLEIGYVDGDHVHAWGEDFVGEHFVKVERALQEVRAVLVNDALVLDGVQNRLQIFFRYGRRFAGAFF